MKLGRVWLVDLIVCALGMGVVAAKAAIEHFPPILLMALRFGLTALVMVWFVKPPWRFLPKVFVVAMVATVQYSLTYTGIRGLDSSTTALLFQLQVPFAAGP